MTTLNFSFDLNAVNVVLEGLAELPAKRSFQLIAAIQRSTQEQLDAQQLAAEAATVENEKAVKKATKAAKSQPVVEEPAKTDPLG